MEGAALGRVGESVGAAHAGVTRRGFLCSSAAIALGCTAVGAPPLAELYRDAERGRELPPLVVIPGAYGSLLREARSGREIWPGPAWRVLFSRYETLAVAFDEDSLEPVAGAVEAPSVLPERLGKDFYGELLRTLERYGGYERCSPGRAPAARRSYYVLSYDWRLDNTLAARGLHELIEQIRRDHRDPALPVDVLAHSNGGLVARYFARFGSAALPEEGTPTPESAPAAPIRRMLLVGTPNLGTLQPVLAGIRGDEMGLQRVPQEVAATASGGLQLMPHPAEPWLASVRGRTLARDVFDLDTWRELRWCLFDPVVRERTIAHHGGGAAGRRYLAALERYFARHLGRARRFATLLAEPSPAGDARPYLFGGDCHHTLARLVVERQGEALRRARTSRVHRGAAGGRRLRVAHVRARRPGGHACVATGRQHARLRTPAAGDRARHVPVRGAPAADRESHVPEQPAPHSARRRPVSARGTHRAGANRRRSQAMLRTGKLLALWGSVLWLVVAGSASADTARRFHQDDRVFIRQREQFFRIEEPHVHLQRARKSFLSDQMRVAADELERAAAGFAYFAERAAGQERQELERAERGLTKLADDVRARRIGEVTNLDRALADAERILAQGPPAEAPPKAPEAK